MTARLPLRLVAVALLLLAAAGCGKPRTSVVLISIDSLRYDDAFGDAGGRAIAPRLRQLAGSSLWFERAYTAAPWTTPSMMGVMSGMPAPAHGVEEHDRALAASIGTLAERYRKAGYRTVAFVPEITLRPEFGFSRGFDTYDLENYGHTQPSSPSLTGKVLNRLEALATSKEPFFLWVHLWDPHYNYVAPAPFDNMFPAGTKPESEDLQCLKWAKNAVTPAGAEYLRGTYRGEVAYTDKYLGDVLDALQQKGFMDRTVLVVMADHGEAFQEHGWLTHTNTVDQEVVHVPLLLKGQGITPGRVGDVVSTTQLGRTLLKLTGVDDAGFGIADALPLGPAANAAPNDGPGPHAVVETIRQGCLTAIASKKYKYVIDHRTCAGALYDLESDPGEQHDLAPSQTELAARWRGYLRADLDRIRALKIPRGTMPAGAVNEAQAALKSLGYVGGNGPLQTGCPLAPGAQRDTFGDSAAAACPADAAWRCF